MFSNEGNKTNQNRRKEKENNKGKTSLFFYEGFLSSPFRYGLFGWNSGHPLNDPQQNSGPPNYVSLSKKINAVK